MNRDIILICHNLRSCHNIGSLLRTAEGLGLSHVYLTGYTPYPMSGNDDRMPHLAQKIDRQIHKTALGAEKLVAWDHEVDVFKLVLSLKTSGYEICALEQTPSSIQIQNFKPSTKLVLIVGREVEGIEPGVLAISDKILEIPMQGKKESFNVVQAAAMALYQCRYY